MGFNAGPGDRRIPYRGELVASHSVALAGGATDQLVLTPEDYSGFDTLAIYFDNAIAETFTVERTDPAGSYQPELAWFKYASTGLAPVAWLTRLDTFRITMQDIDGFAATHRYDVYGYRGITPTDLLQPMSDTQRSNVLAAGARLSVDFDVTGTYRRLAIWATCGNAFDVEIQWNYADPSLAFPAAIVEVLAAGVTAGTAYRTTIDIPAGVALRARVRNQGAGASPSMIHAALLPV